MTKQPAPIEEITPHAKPRICINRHEAYELLKEKGIDGQIMPLIDALIKNNITLKDDNLQLMQQIEAGGSKSISTCIRMHVNE